VHADKIAEADRLTAEETEQWSPCLNRIINLGFEEDEAENILRKAFGWSGQGYWRKSKVKEVPSEEQVLILCLLQLCSHVVLTLASTHCILVACLTVFVPYRSWPLFSF
jgi:hypothetical protein